MAPSWHSIERVKKIPPTRFCVLDPTTPHHPWHQQGRPVQARHRGRHNAQSFMHAFNSVFSKEIDLWADILCRGLKVTLINFGNANKAKHHKWLPYDLIFKSLISLLNTIHRFSQLIIKSCWIKSIMYIIQLTENRTHKSAKKMVAVAGKRLRRYPKRTKYEKENK